MRRLILLVPLLFTAACLDVDKDELEGEVDEDCWEDEDGEEECEDEDED